MNRYNVYHEGEMILSDVKLNDVVSVTGITRDHISRYINEDRIYHGKRGNFTFDYSGEYTLQNPPQGFKKEWDHVRFKLNPEAKVEDENKISTTQEAQEEQI